MSPLDLWKPNQLFNMAFEYYVDDDCQTTNLNNKPDIRKMNRNNSPLTQKKKFWPQNFNSKEKLTNVGWSN